MAEFTNGEKPKRRARARRNDGEFAGKRKRGRKGLSLVIMIIAVVLALLVMMVGFITDWMWFGDLGYTSVFWKRLLTQLEIGVPVFVVIYTGITNLVDKKLKKRSLPVEPEAYADLDHIDPITRQPVKTVDEDDAE